MCTQLPRGGCPSSAGFRCEFFNTMHMHLKKSCLNLRTCPKLTKGMYPDRGCACAILLSMLQKRTDRFNHFVREGIFPRYLSSPSFHMFHYVSIRNFPTWEVLSRSLHIWKFQCHDPTHCNLHPKPETI